MPNDKSNPDFDPMALTQAIGKLIAGGDHQSAAREIHRPWPGMQEDLKLAVNSLMKEIVASGTAPLFIKGFEFDGSADLSEGDGEDYEDDLGNMTIELADWVVDAQNAFRDRYPKPGEGDRRFQRTFFVLMDWLFDPEAPFSREDLNGLMVDWLHTHLPDYQQFFVH